MDAYLIKVSIDKSSSAAVMVDPTVAVTESRAPWVRTHHAHVYPWQPPDTHTTSLVLTRTHKTTRLVNEDCAPTTHTVTQLTVNKHQENAECPPP